MSDSQYLTDDTIFIYNDILHEDDARDDSNSRIDSSRTDVPKFSLFSHCSTIGLFRDTVEGRGSLRHATGLLQFNRIGMTWWHQVYLLTTLLPSAHRDLRDLCYIRLKQNQTAGGSDEALGKPELTHGWLAPSSTPNKWNLLLILFFIWSIRRVFDFFLYITKAFSNRSREDAEVTNQLNICD